MRTGPLAILVLLAGGIVLAAESANPFAGLGDRVQVLAVDATRLADARRDVLQLEDAAAPRDALDARQRLIRRDDAGLRAVLDRLVEGGWKPDRLDALLHVVAVSANPVGEPFLVTAAAQPAAAIRMLAADSLAAGHTAQAVETLAGLARDPVPGVRVVALRALFAIDSEAAAAARHALPLDPRPDLAARRLRWHRTRWSEHDTPGRAALLSLAETAWRKGRTPEERTEGALLLASGRLGAAPELLRRVLDETGTDELGAAAVRRALGTGLDGYDALTMRKTAILAAWASMRQADEAEKADLLDRAVGWLARPAGADAYDPRPVPETILRMVLPDFGEAIVPPVMRRLREGGFDDPQDGVFLLTEALDAKRATEELGVLLEEDPALPSGVRVAAADGLLSIRRVGPEARARWLLREGERHAVRRDVVHALAEEERTYAIGLLKELLDNDDEDLVDAAVHALESREDDTARGVLVEHLFLGAENPHQRLEHLVEPGDDLAFEVLSRALNGPRLSLRLAALERLARAKNLQGDRGRALVLGYPLYAKSKNARTHEYEQILYAMMAQAPETSLDYIRKQWDVFTSLGWTHTPLKLLRHLHGKAVSPGVVDLVLEKIGWDGQEPHAPPFLLIHAATALEARRGHRDDELDRLWRGFLEHEDQDLALASIRSLRHPGRGDLTDLLVPRLQKLDVANPERAIDGAELIEALDHQPFEKTESALVDLALDSSAESNLRRRAARSLVGRISETARGTLLDWLLDADLTRAEPTVMRCLARVVGTGGGKDVASRLVTALESKLREHFAEDADLDPDAPLEPGLGETVHALARAAAFTEDPDALARIARSVFLPRFVTYARRSVNRQETEMGPNDASAAARTGSDVNVRWHRAGGPYAGLPPEVWWITDALKVVPDAILAEILLEAVPKDGPAAVFPDLYYDRIIARLHDKATHDRAKAAAVLETVAWLAEPVGGAVDFGIQRDRIERSIWAGRFADARDAQQTLLAILTRRAYDDDVGWTWRRQRGVLEALRGAAAAEAGDLTTADARFRAAERIDPYDSQVLSAIARLRALLGLDLEDALRLAQRAATLERRRSARGEATADTGGILGLVRLKRGEAVEAAHLLSVIARESELRQPFQGGRHHLHLAEALLQAGYPRDAGIALLKALELEPSLEDEIQTREAFQSWRESGRLERILDQARKAYWIRLEED